MIKAFVKTASLPNWLHGMTKSINPVSKLPTYSKKGVTQMWKRRSVTK